MKRVRRFAIPVCCTDPFDLRVPNVVWDFATHTARVTRSIGRVVRGQQHACVRSAWRAFAAPELVTELGLRVVRSRR